MTSTQIQIYFSSVLQIIVGRTFVNGYYISTLFINPRTYKLTHTPIRCTRRGVGMDGTPLLICVPQKQKEINIHRLDRPGLALQDHTIIVVNDVI